MNWKCILPALAFCILSGAASFAQQRHCDMEITLISPAEGQVLQPLAHFEIKVKIENLGPDTLFAGDTTYYTTSMMVLVTSNFFILTEDILPGQSADFLLEEVANVNDNPEDEVVSFCVRVLDKPDTLNNGSFEDSLVANNFDCNEVTIISGETSILETKDNHLFSIYPNPALDKLHLQFPEERFHPAEISILDLNGRVLKQFHIPDAKSKESLDISDLNAGIYFLKCSNGKQDAFRKFIKR